MSIFKKLFGKKKNSSEEVSDELKTDPEILDIVSTDAPADLKDKDYKHNHCIVFFGINQESFNDIHWTFENSDGPDGLSLLRSKAGVITTNFCSYKAGSETVKGKIADQKELRGWVEEEFNNNTEEFKDQFVSDENSEIASDFLELLNKEKPFLIQHIQVAMTIWANSEFFEQDDFMGAMFLFFKSSKKFDKDDITSENQDRMNMVLTSSFLSACFRNLNNCLKVNYIIDNKVSSIYGGEEDEDGDFYHDNAFDSIMELSQGHEPGGNEIGHLFRFHDHENPHSDPHNDYKNDLAYYFDQDGRGWKVEEIDRKGAVSLLHDTLDGALVKY